MKTNIPKQRTPSLLPADARLLWDPGEVRTPLSQGLHRLISEPLAEAGLSFLGVQKQNRQDQITYICIYIYIERERGRERERGVWGLRWPTTVQLRFVTVLKI